MIQEHKAMYEEVKALLYKHAGNEEAATIYAPWVASHSLMMNHLYQDLGLQSRTEMGKFMKEYFPTLAEGKPKEKLWKKYLYDCIGKVAPACASCDDQVSCFSCMILEGSA